MLTMTREARGKGKWRYRREEGRGGEGRRRIPHLGSLIRQWRRGGRREGQEEDLDKPDIFSGALAHTHSLF